MALPKTNKDTFPPMSDENSWNEYRKLVLHDLERLDQAVRESEEKLSAKMDQLQDCINRIDKKVVSIQAKAGLIGALAGILASLVSVFQFMK